jgi:protein TonB
LFLEILLLHWFRIEPGFLIIFTSKYFSLMKNKKTIKTLDEMLFESKNKAYGAYDLRKEYASHLTKAFAIALSGVLVISLSSFLIVRNSPRIIKPDINTDHKLVDWPINPPNIPEPITEKKVTSLAKQEVFRQEVIPELLIRVEDEKDIEEVDVPTDEQLIDVVIAKEKQDGQTSTSVFDNSDNKDQVGTLIKESERVIEPIVEKEFLRAEVMPEFKDGLKMMYKWLGNNLRYPVNATYNSIQCKVTFNVEKDGQISNVQVLKGIGFGCEEEAERVINKMPK